MSGNRGVVYLGQGKVELQSIPYPKIQDPQGKQLGKVTVSSTQAR